MLKINVRWMNQINNKNKNKLQKEISKYKKIDRNKVNAKLVRKISKANIKFIRER